MTKGDDQLTKKDFLPLTVETAMVSQEDIPPPAGFAKETILLLLQNKVAMTSFAMLVILGLGAICLPLLSHFDFATQNVAFANRPFFSTSPQTGLLHLLGTDHLGRDIFVRVWYGVRISLMIAVVVTIIDGIVGVIYGSISGYVGGAVDTAMMRVLEVIDGIPYLVVVLLLMAVLPQGIITLIIAYTLVGWTGMARLVRGQVTSLVNREFIIAAKIMGVSMNRIILQHLIPNTLGIIIVRMTLDIPGIIFTEAFLSMLGMGVPPPYPSLGTMVNEGIAIFQVYPARLLVPAVLIGLIMLAFNLLGDQLQDTIDPKLRKGARR